MQYIKIMLGILSLIVFSCAYSGFYASTSHSRANCAGFNESITWNWSEHHWWSVKSIHFCNKNCNSMEGYFFTHEVIAPMAYTWRAAAYHAQEAAGALADRWWVQGYHYYMSYDGSAVFDSYTQAGNCNIYDGWWDKPKAKGE